MWRGFRRVATAAATLIAALASPAIGQPVATQPTPQTAYNIDQNGVDVVTGSYFLRTTDVAVGGGGDSGLSYGRYTRNFGYDDDYTTALSATSGGGFLSIGPMTDEFGSGPQSLLGTGARLTGGAGNYLYTTSAGVTYSFTAAVSNAFYRVAPNRVVQINWPNGRRIILEYDLAQVWTNTGPGETGQVQISRVKAVVGNDGYRLVLRYATNDLPPNGPDGPISGEDTVEWQTLASVVGTNAGSIFCDAASTASACVPGGSSPNVQYSWDGQTETRVDAMGRVTRITYDSSWRITDVTRSSNDDLPIHLTYDVNGRVASYTIGYGRTGARTWTYAYSDSGGVRTTTITSPSTLQRVVVSTLATLRITSDKTGTAAATTYTYDSFTRPLEVIAPEGNKVAYEYDTRSNVKKTTLTPKTGSSATPIVTEAAYPTDTECTTLGASRCNLPTSTTDANGNVTDYEYTSFGAISRVRRPALTGSDPRPEINYSYEQLRAWYRFSASGGIEPGSGLIWKPTGSTACATAATCAGTAGETVTEIGYGPGSSTEPRNLLPRTVTARSGNTSGTGAVSATTAYSYSDAGDVTATDGPLSGTGDTVHRIYNKARELEGAISPLPGGNGPDGQPLKRRATRVVRNATTGLVTSVEAGTTDDTTLVSFTRLQWLESDYDLATYVKTQERGYGVESSTGTLYSLTQYSYDDDLRPWCTALRASLTAASDVCVQGGNATTGWDQTSQTDYDSAGRVAANRSNGRAVATFAYTANSRVSTVADANGNVTTYSYDPFDRQSRTTYSDTTYDEVAYAPGGQVTSERRRSGETVNYQYFGRNLVYRRIPSGSNIAQAYYGYDLFDRPLEIQGAGTFDWSNTISWTWDALSRPVTQTANTGNTGDHVLTMAHDPAGRRTRLTWGQTGSWGGGFYVDYDYLLTGEVTHIRENGASSGVGVLASYVYDDVGNRRRLTRGNGVVTNWTPDGFSRLKQLADTLPAPGAGQTVGLTYNNVQQIAGRTASNDGYAYPNYAPATQNVTPNYLNQMGVLSGATPAYDENGNLTNDTRGNLYAYNTDNQLVTKGSSPNLAYDPAGRLATIAGPATVRFDYDGVAMVAESDASGALQRRYVHGPGIDEPLVWYEGSGTTDRRFLAADERGSITSITDAGGNLLRTNAYDENGVPAQRNLGRFGYTGQAWLPEVNLAYYKARMYDPTIGRFLQTDPIGYEGGINLYAYVGGDPINRVDPTGRCSVTVWAVMARTVYEDGFKGPPYLHHTFVTFDSPCDSPSSGRSNAYQGGGSSGSASVGTGTPQSGLVDRCASRATNNAIRKQFRVGGGAMRGQSRPFLDQLKDKYAIHADPFSGSFLTKSYWASHVDVWDVAGFVAMAAVKGAAPSGPNLRATFDVGRTVGYDRETNFGNTSYVTVIFGPEGLRDPSSGLPTRPLVSVYPGC